MRLPVYPYHPARQAPPNQDQRRAVIPEWHFDEPYRLSPPGLGPSRPDLAPNLARQYEEKPEPTGSTIVLELDEMWHYLKKKRQKLWIWKALDRDIGQLLDWEGGRRDKTTLKKMVDRLAPWDVKLYCTDKWATYASVISQDTLVQSKATTHAIEPTFKGSECSYRFFVLKASHTRSDQGPAHRSTAGDRAGPHRPAHPLITSLELDQGYVCKQGQHHRQVGSLSAFVSWNLLIMCRYKNEPAAG